MSGTHYRYTYEELVALQHSPLVKKPDNLPSIAQWIESAAPAERKPRNPPNGKGEDGEITPRRPPFESRLRRKSQSGEEIFLGPKMSFSAASAARQRDKPGSDAQTERSDEPRSLAKFDRFAKDRVPRELEGRDRDHERPRTRYGHSGVDHDDENEGRPRRDYANKDKDHKDGGVTLDGASNRRSGPMRGKFEQPWMRESNKIDDTDGDRPKRADTRSDWRDRDRERRNDDRRHDNPAWGRDYREHREESTPLWMQETQENGDSGGHNPDELKKWIAERKAADSAAKAPVQAVEEKHNVNIDDETFGPPFTTGHKEKETTAKSLPLDKPLFGWGETKSAEVQIPTVAKPKSSRFAGLFAPKQEQQVIEQPQHTPLDGPINNNSNPHTRPVSSSADALGMQNILQMLRLGGSPSGVVQQKSIVEPPSSAPPTKDHRAQQFDQTSGGQSQNAAKSPQPNVDFSPLIPNGRHQSHAGQPSRMQMPAELAAVSSRGPTQSSRPATSHHPREHEQEFEHYEQLSMPIRPREADSVDRHRPAGIPNMHMNQRPETAPPARQELPSHDREFLLGLMKPRQPFSEAQIYGQGYQNTRKDGIDMNAMLGNFTARSQEARNAGPPPGFVNSNKQAFTGIDLRTLQQSQPQPPAQLRDNHPASLQMRDVYSGPSQHHHLDAQKYSHNLQHEAGLPPWATGRAAEQQHMPHVPPGFAPPRGSAPPPGLPQYQAAGLAAHHQPAPNGHRGPAIHPGQPPQFYNGHGQMHALPPGFQQTHVGSGPQHPRRPPMPNPVSAQNQNPNPIYDPYRSGPGMQQQQMHQMGYPPPPPQHFMEQQQSHQRPGPGGY